MAKAVNLEVIDQISNALLKQVNLEKEIEELKDLIKAKQDELKAKKEQLDADSKLFEENKELVELLKRNFAAHRPAVSSTGKKRGRSANVSEEQKKEAVLSVLGDLKASKVKRIKSSDFLAKCNDHLGKESKPNDATFYKDAIEAAKIKSEGERRGKEFIIE